MNFISLLALLFVFAYLIYSFVLVYHLTRFGIGTKPKKVALVYFIGSVLLLMVLFVLYIQIDIGEVKNRSQIPVERILS